MLRRLAISTLVIAGICGVAHADVYRWVDAKGEAHYSDRWVPGSELIVSRGIGVSGLPLRVACPPEALLVTLRRALG